MPSTKVPTPADMPKRRMPQVPASTAAPARRAVHYRIATEIPRRGWADATAWLDSGIFLFAGTDPDLLARLRARYGARARVASAVDREVRGWARQRPSVDAPDADHDLYDAAVAAVNALLLAGTGMPVDRLADDELPLVEPIKARLAALANTTKDHGGEAELIVLAARAAGNAAGSRHILLTNDAGASVVAHEKQLPARHAGDVLAEMACSDPGLDCDTCWAKFQVGHAISGIAGNARPRGRDDFICHSSDGTCENCATA